MKITALAALLIASVGGIYLYHNSQQGGGISHTACKLKTGMRKLWADHVVWTREYIVAALSNAEDLKEVTTRLLQNQVDIGNAIAPYYGNEAGHKLAELLKEHILGAADVVAAAKAGDHEKLAAADERWHQNAREISEFLSSANPNWPYNDLVTMFNEHLKLTTQEAVFRLKKEWSQDIRNFDNIFDQIMMMADTLTNGIMKQFPNKF